jgi:hypothetical protein
MKITKRQLRQLINEELHRVDEGPLDWLEDKWDSAVQGGKELIQDEMVDPALDEIEIALSDFLLENADSLAEQIIPDFKLLPDIAEDFAKQILSLTLKKKSDEIASCVRGLIDPEIIDSAKQNVT